MAKNLAHPQKVKLAELAKNLHTAGNPNSGNGLLKYLSRYGCSMLNAGCFAAGTKLWTPLGYQNVEILREGDLLFARNEFDPAGPIEAKPIEQVFRRFTEIVHLHAGGQLLRTTQEHPFYVFDQGWTPVSDLHQGDWLLTANGDWQQVEEIYYTGELEVVYNLRVADHHTYFVGDENWGWPLWAHNTYDTFVAAAEAARPNKNVGAKAGELYTKFMKEFNAGNGSYSKTQLIKDLRGLNISPSDARNLADMAYADYLIKFESEKHALPRDIDMIHSPTSAWHAYNFPIELLIDRALTPDESRQQSRWLSSNAAKNAAAKWDANYANSADAHSVPINNGEGVVITVASDRSYVTTNATRAFVIRQTLGDYVYIHTYPILPTHALYNNGPP